MIALSSTNEKPVRAQIAESVSLIAELDFPERWPDLIDVRHPFIALSSFLTYWQQLVQSLSSNDFNVNLGVLETAHSIFRSWRSQARSDAFWSIIKLVHSKFLAPYFRLFELTLSQLLPSPDLLLAQTMAVLVELFYDLTCQDLAPEFEDGHETFFAPETGYFMRLMEWNPPQLQTDVCIPGPPLMPFLLRTEVLQPDEPTPSIPSKIRTAVLEIAEVRFLLSDLFRTHRSALVVCQTIPRNARALSVSWSLCQEGLGARWRRQATWYCVRPGTWRLFLSTPERATLTRNIHSSCLNLSASFPPRSSPVLIATYSSHVIQSKALSPVSWCLISRYVHAILRGSKIPRLSISAESYRYPRFQRHARLRQIWLKLSSA